MRRARLILNPSSGRERGPRRSSFQATAVDIELAREINVNTDGEVFSVTRCEYRVLPGVARFFAGEAPFAQSDPGKA